jgi:hypothetical protein
MDVGGLLVPHLSDAVDALSPYITGSGVVGEPAKLLLPTWSALTSALHLLTMRLGLSNRKLKEGTGGRKELDVEQQKTRGDGRKEMDECFASAELAAGRRPPRERKKLKV